MSLAQTLDGLFDFIQFFTSWRAELEDRFSELRGDPKPDGMLWISCPKRTSKLPTDLTENVLREIILPRGLVDVKVCAVGDTWSGLKFVFRTRDRR